jgi:DNA-binding transcriptional MerR regulator
VKRTTLRIGEAAAHAGVSPDTLRYYERRGALPKPARTSAGYRVYSEEALVRVQFVRNALRFGFSLKQIARFVQARDAGHPPCREVRAAAQRILIEMDRQIDELHAARATVRDVLVEWDRRLARTPDGAAARLLGTLPSTGRGPSTRSRLRQFRREA